MGTHALLSYTSMPTMGLALIVYDAADISAVTLASFRYKIDVCSYACVLPIAPIGVHAIADGLST